MNQTTMPAFFLAHGNPMSAIENNHFTRDWINIHDSTPTPSAIVVFSAHWHVPGTRILDVSHPQTIHDFGGFPRELYEQQYPCPGAPELARNMAGTLMQQGLSARTDSQWGLDHGTWCLLKHLYPAADIPVLQISLDSSNHDLLHHYRIGQALQEYRDHGVLFIGSGNIVHNLRRWFSYQPGDDISWAVEFDAAIGEAIRRRDIDTLAHYQRLPHAREAVPTVEHYLPLLYVMGLARDSDQLAFSDFGFSDLSTASSRSVKFYPA